MRTVDLAATLGAGSGDWDRDGDGDGGGAGFEEHAATAIRSAIRTSRQ
jgi:hypothetical protein